MAKNPITILAEGNKLLDELEKKLIGVNTNLLEISKSARDTNLKDYFNAKSPNDVNEKLKLQSTIIDQLNAELRERNKLEQALSNQLAKNKLAESDLNKELVKQRFETQQLNKINKETAILSSKLSTEYQKLVVMMNQAGASVQNLTAKQAQGIKLSNKEQAELKQSSLEFKKYQAAVIKADASVGRFQRNVGNYQSAFGKAGLALRNFAGTFGVLSAGVIAKEIFDLVKEIDGLDKALKQVTETQAGFNQAQDFIKNLADEAGVGINSLQKAYTKFFAAAKTTNLTLAETQDIFRQTAKAGAVLGLSTDDINGSLRALEQILSKGKVQAEEIRGQLGERLPGAFQILAKSMGLTTAELSKQLELGNVLSDEVLPGFAKELEKAYNLGTIDRVQTLTAAQNRLSNSWNSLIRATTEGGVVTNLIIGIFNSISKSTTRISEGITSLTSSFDIFKKGLNDFLVPFRELIVGTPILNNLFKLGTTLVQKFSDAFSTPGITVFSTALKLTGALLSGFGNALVQTKTEVVNFVKSLALFGQIEFDPLSPFKTFASAKNVISGISKNFLNSGVNVAQAFRNGYRDALKPIVKETEDVVAKVEEVTKNTAKSNDTVRNGSIIYFKNLINELKKERDELSLTQEEYAGFTKQIDEASAALVRLEDSLKGTENKPVSELKTEVNLTPTGLGDAEFQAYLTNEQRKRDESIETAKIRKELEEEVLDNAIASFNQGFELVGTIFDAKAQKYEDDINKNNDYYAALLDNENLSEEQRSALEAERDRKNLELEKKKREEQRKAAVANKIQALANVAINTAVAVSKVLAQTGTLGTFIIPSILALGALQAATIAAQPIPKYEKGKGDYDNYEGAAIWGEKRQEVKISKDGNIEFSPNRIGNHLTHVKKDDVIHPDASKFISSLTDKELYNDIHRYSIIASMQGQSNALNAMMMTKSIDNQTERLIQAFKENKTKVNVHNNNSIGNDLRFLTRLNNTL